MVLDSAWYHVMPVSAMGPTVNGAIMLLYKVPPVADFEPQSWTDASGCHCWIAVPLGRDGKGATVGGGQPAMRGDGGSPSDEGGGVTQR